MAPTDVDRLQGVAYSRGVGDVNATDVTPETSMVASEYAANVVRVSFTPDASLVANGANYATLAVYKRDSNGVQTLIASVQTIANGWTTGVPVLLTVAGGGVNPGDVFTYAVTKTGTGVIVPTGRFVVKLDTNFITTRIAIRSTFLEGRLRKRGYVIPFQGPDLVTIQGWLMALVQKDAFDRRGYNPSSADDAAAIVEPYNQALADVKEAADSQNGLLDLALNTTNASTSGVTAGGPLGYSETSPYVWADIQQQNGAIEDQAGAGTSSSE